MNTSIVSDDFSLEPELRARCYTWPMPHVISPINEMDPEIDDCPSSITSSVTYLHHQTPDTPMTGYNLSGDMISNYGSNHSIATSCSIHNGSSNSIDGINSNLNIGNNNQHTTLSDHHQMPMKKKRIRKRNPDAVSQKKPNPWGEESYSDLIAKALECAPDKRMKLNEIYQWFSENIPYFNDRSSQEEAAGWKNSIRHNLSLHNRFMRIQNEGAGKSSWWVINPDAKNGRSQRRQRDRSNTIDTSKSAIDKKRRGAKKKTEHLNVMGLRTSVQSGLNNSIYGSNTPSLSHETFNQDQDDLMSANTFDSFTGFRQRAESNLSVQGNVNGVSPTLDAFDEYDAYPCYDMSSANNGSQVGEILDRTNQMQLGDGGMDPNGYRMSMGTGMINNPMKSIKEIIKPGDMAPQPPPSYHELNSVRNGTSMQQSPLLRTQLNGPMDKNSPSSLPPNGNNPMSPNGGYYNPSYSGQMVHQQMWMSSPMAQPPPAHLQGHIMQHNTMNQISHHQMQQMNQMQGNNMLSCGAQSGNELPQDLQNLNMIETTQMTEMDFESLMRHEISINSNAPINFDL
uniref:Forkhead box protein O n=1 Tax=Strongyloides stercoralis TaxID=6248 RepID=Q6WKW1_STRER|nr:forkhead transcription factor 1 isoform b [Strongyloides stercoralis]AAQ23180.1 forkhead transcription factor 1 isoform b [Strongyloides stercoralis]QWX95789.1 forkhead box transcription factor isoform B [Strongyloides stercoralis]